MITFVKINGKPVFKWTSLINLTLDFSQHDGTRGVVQISVLLFSEVLTGCWIGISGIDIDLKVVHLLTDLCEELSNRTWRIHRSYMMNASYTTTCPLKAWSGYQVSFPCISKTICCGHKVALGIIVLNDQGHRFQIAEQFISHSLTRICEWSSRLFAKLHQENRCMWTFPLLVIQFPQKSNISCRVNSCVDWHIIALGWMASH